MDDKLARRTKGGLTPGAPGDPFVDAGACKALAAVSIEGSERPRRRRIEAIGAASGAACGSEQIGPPLVPAA